MMRFSIIPMMIILFTILMIAPAMASPVTISVNVIDMNGDAVEGAKATLQNGDYLDLGTSMTDINGDCKFQNIDINSAVLRVKVEKNENGTEHIMTSVWHNVKDLTVIHVNLTTYPTPGTGYITGSVMMDGKFAGRSIVVIDDKKGYWTNNMIMGGYIEGDIPDNVVMNDFEINAKAGEHSIYAVCYAGGKLFRSDTMVVEVKPSYDPEKATNITLELMLTGDDVSSLPEFVNNLLFNRYVPEEKTASGPISVSGKLIGAGGQPLKEYIIRLLNSNNRALYETFTDDSGDFKFNDVTIPTDTMRFEVSLLMGDTVHSENTQWYMAQNLTDEKIQVFKFPLPERGQIWGFISDSEDFLKVEPYLRKPLDGIVYLDNGMSQNITGDYRQFYFDVDPGTYEIWAVHYEGNQKFVSEKKTLNVEATWSAVSVNPTLLVVKPQEFDPLNPLFIGVILFGLVCLAVEYYALKRWP